jgi:hypothetical protein
MASPPIVPILLRGGRVIAPFREALFRAANRAGMSVNEFALFAAGHQLRASGVNLTGVFEQGDLDVEFSNENAPAPATMHDGQQIRTPTSRSPNGG